MRFRKKPVVIEAYQFHYTRDVYGKWRAAYLEEYTGVRGARTWRERVKDWWKGFPHYYVDTLEGTSYAVTNGDWIIKGVAGEFYPCKPEIFEKTYELAEPTVEAK